MYDRAFFRTKLGRAALLSIAAMLAMNIVSLQGRGQAEAAGPAATSESTSLA